MVSHPIGTGQRSIYSIVSSIYATPPKAEAVHQCVPMIAIRANALRKSAFIAFIGG
jgi:hypothetical protein